MSKLKFINYILQIFFIRIYRTLDVDIHDFENRFTTTGYGVLYWIIPFTGWTSKFRFFGAKIKKRPLWTISRKP